MPDGEAEVRARVRADGALVTTVTFERRDERGATRGSCQSTVRDCEQKILRTNPRMLLLLRHPGAEPS